MDNKKNNPNVNSFEQVKKIRHSVKMCMEAVQRALVCKRINFLTCINSTSGGLLELDERGKCQTCTVQTIVWYGHCSAHEATT